MESVSSRDLAAIFFRYSKPSCHSHQELALLGTLRNAFDLQSSDICHMDLTRSVISQRVTELATELGLTLEEGVLEKAEITVEMLRNNRTVIQSGPSMTCKSLVLKASF